MAEIKIKNRGSVPIPYDGKSILPGRVKAVDESDLPLLRKLGNIQVIPEPAKRIETKPLSQPDSEVEEEVIPLEPEESLSEPELKEDKPKKKSGTKSKKKRSNS